MATSSGPTAPTTCSASWSQGGPQSLSTAATAELVEGFVGGNSAYLGVPLLLVLLVLGLRWWSNAVVRVGSRCPCSTA
jgi:hypothetical protein